MSTSLLYHALGVRGYRYTRSHFLEGETIFAIEQKRQLLRCSVCGSQELVRHGGPSRLFRSLPIGKRPTLLLLKVPRVYCYACQVTRQVPIDFADPKRSYTHAFERYALELSQHTTIQAAAKHLGVGWDTIKDIQKRHLEKRFAKPKLKHVRLLAIDEISIGKGHRYLTVVLDLESGAVVFVGDGKGADALDPFWRRLRSSRARIQAVALDMSQAYILAVREHLPRATLVFDRFHVVKLFNERLSDFRRDLQREATQGLHKQVLKGTRWLLLKNPENLDPERRERERLEEALRINKPLAAAYYMKEDLRQIWEQPDKRTAARVLADWIRRAEASGIKILHQMAATLGAHRHGILAYYDHTITTGPLEGTNNKIKTMQRQAYGFRDQRFLKLKIYALHQMRYALVG